MRGGILGFRHSLESHSTALNVTLWAVQALLGIVFVMAGYAKLFTPIGLLALDMPWVEDVSGNLVRFIGTMELLGGIGILLPALVGILPQLTGLAALGLTVIMGLATGFHLMRAEFDMAGFPLVMGILAAFVAWGRMSVLRFPSK